MEKNVQPGKEEFYEELLENTHIIRRIIGTNLDDLAEIGVMTKKLLINIDGFIKNEISSKDLISIINEWLKSSERCKKILHTNEDYKNTKKKYEQHKKLLHEPGIIVEDWGISEGYEDTLKLMKIEMKLLSKINELSKRLSIILSKINNKEDVRKDLTHLVSTRFLFGKSPIKSILKLSEALIREYHEIVHELNETESYLYRLEREK